MERRHTFTSFSFRALPAGWSLSLVLPWICLVVVASTTAYGLQLGAAAMVASASADQLDGSYQAAIGMVLITGQDATTGDSRQVECVTARDRIASDALLVELKDLRAIAAQVCNGAIAPAIGPADPE